MDEILGCLPTEVSTVPELTKVVATPLQLLLSHEVIVKTVVVELVFEVLAFDAAQPSLQVVTVWDSARVHVVHNPLEQGFMLFVTLPLGLKPDRWDGSNHVVFSSCVTFEVVFE